MATDHQKRARFEALYSEHLTPVTRWALRHTDPATAQDIVAETFLVAWRRLDQVPQDRPLVWLVTVANNMLANWHRAEQRRSALTVRLRDEAPTVNDFAEPESIDPDMARALRRLGDRDRELILLISVEGLAVNEAARVLGMSAATARVRLHRLRARLRAELRGSASDPKPRRATPDEKLS